MIENLPFWINALFIVVTIVTIVLFYFSNGKSLKIVLVIVGWSVIQSILAFQGFYLNHKTIPPRFTLVILPALLLLIYGCLPRNFNPIIDRRNLTFSTLLHAVRFPIEIVLFYLFLHQMIPEIMTFHGFNFDIITGAAAPVLSILYRKNKLNKLVLLIFNSIGLILVFTILIIGLLASQLPFQQYGLEQPNRAVNYFPFILLPATVVPIIIYTHITDLIKLSRQQHAIKLSHEKK
jgi:peptidoglycan/LPS O-acetylase OafA/YrhL